ARPAPTEIARSEAPPSVVQSVPSPSGTTRSELPNPLLGAPAGDTAPAENRERPPSGPASAAGSQPLAVTPTQPTVTHTSPPAARRAETGVAGAPAGGGAEAAAPRGLTYRASSWTQVRDGKGQIVLLRTVPAGAEQAIRGTPPFDVVIGNARAVSVVYRGQPI